MQWWDRRYHLASSREELIDEILHQHLAEGDVETISASKVARWLSSPFALYCDMFGPEDERDPISDSLEMRRERGVAYEEELEGETLTIPYQTLEEGFRLTVEMMAAGEPVISQGLLISKPVGMIGIPDQLRKMNNSKLPSVFGNYRYRVVEVKIHFNLTSTHIIQAAFYNRLLGLVQGLTPKTFVMINGHGEKIIEEFAEYEYSLDRSIRGVHQVITGARPEPVFGGTPEPWRSFGDKLAKVDLTRLLQIGGPRRESLVEAGYYTVADIARANEEDLSVVPKLDSYVAGLIVPQAKAILEGAPISRKPVQLSEAPVEIFLDMENMNEGADVQFGTQNGFVNFLIGAVIRSGTEDRYVDFFAETPDEEEKCWLEFCEWIASYEAPIIYYWSASAEPVYIRKMMRKYQTASDVRDKLANAVDLHRTTTDAFAFPTETYGLKDIARYLGFRWRLLDRDGLWAMMAYNQYVNLLSAWAFPTRRALGLRNDLLKYNEDDCRAAMYVKDWLVAHSSNS